MPEPAVKIRNAAQALRAALGDFQERSLPQSPSINLTWGEKTLYAEGNADYAVTGRLFTSDDWKAEVAQDVAPLSRTIYMVTVFSSASGWYWRGQIKADGSITETSAVEILPAQKKDEVEAEFLRKSSTPPPRPGGYGH